jgi:hypothetical protein
MFWGKYHNKDYFTGELKERVGSGLRHAHLPFIRKGGEKDTLK